MLWTVVTAVMFVLSAAPAAAAETDNDTPTVEQMDLHERGLELKAQEAEFEHQQNLRELELEERRIEIDRMQGGRRWAHKPHGGGFLFLVIVVTNILLTVWVCKDMSEQKIGRALWVPITLLAGVFGAIVYAIVRNADTRAKPEESSKEKRK
jgi:hypothetical protein